ncbi:MAG: META domain-containing protein [Actinobacteria bacterium]|nr:MAG: META domain-containing protein [Actinomycetota bacterium]
MIRFERLTRSLIGSWQVISLLDERGQMRPPLSGTVISAEFDSEGRVTGIAGCNRFRSEYTTYRDNIEFGAIVSTKMACRPEAVMTQERTFLDRLQQTIEFRLSRVKAKDRLDLFDGSGARTLEFVAGTGQTEEVTEVETIRK